MPMRQILFISSAKRKNYYRSPNDVKALKQNETSSCKKEAEVGNDKTAEISLNINLVRNFQMSLLACINDYDIKLHKCTH